MWNKKKEDEYAPRPATAPSTTSTTPPREGVPVSSTPARSHEPRIGSGEATMGKAVMVKGQIFSREDLVLDGELEGTVELQDHRLTIGPNGKLQASVKAREIIVLGSILGNVEATDKIDIRKDAKLIGDIKTARIVIEDGAYFKGNIDIMRPEVKPEPARVQAAAPPPASPPSPPPSLGPPAFPAPPAAAPSPAQTAVQGKR